MTDPKEKALSILKARDKTEYELIEALRIAGYSEEEITETLLYLKDMGYIDDLSYAGRYVQISMDKRRGPKRIERELIEKGVKSSVIYDVMSDEMDYEWETDTAESIAQEIKSKNPALREDKLIAKIVNKLSYEGFDEDIINEIIEKSFIEK